MQAVGMLRGTRAIYLLVLFVSLIGHAHSYPLQFLPSIPGYIPVYIRNGDQPLDEINPALAEAFHEGPSLTKSIKLDEDVAHATSNPEKNESDAFVENTKRNVYSIRIREVENDESAKATDKEDVELERDRDLQDMPKFLSIYELHDEVENREKNEDTHRGKINRKSVASSEETGMKTSEISTAEKEGLGRLAEQDEKDETRPNDLENTNPNFPELPHEMPHRRHEATRNLVPLAKIASIAVDVSSPKDLNSAFIQDSLHAYDEQENASHEEKRKEKPAVKEGGPLKSLYNVGKISPTVSKESSLTNEQRDTNVSSLFRKEAESEEDNENFEEPSIKYDKSTPVKGQDNEKSKEVSDIYDSLRVNKKQNEPILKLQDSSGMLFAVHKITPTATTEISSNVEQEKVHSRSSFEEETKSRQNTNRLQQNSFSENEEVAAIKVTKETGPIKEQEILQILSNVNKISPTTSRKDSETNEHGEAHPSSLFRGEIQSK